MTKKQRRNSLRHSGWNYTATGYYFVTICTAGRVHLFDSAELKQIAETVWQKIPTFKSATIVRLDEWVVMPNHVHGIVVIVEGIAATSSGSEQAGIQRPEKAVSGSVGALVGAYKAAVTHRINNLQGTQGVKIWQRGYYDRVIRNDRKLAATREYIRDNPARWTEDRDNLDALLVKMTSHP